jgi:pyrophosphatase PpaX
MAQAKTILAVLLDWDGTLLDSCEADTAAYLEMFRAMGIGWGRAELEKYYSPDWYNVYRAARLEPTRWEEADRIWRQAYGKHRPRLVAGAREVLRQLRGRYRLGLVTSGDADRVNRQLRRFRLTSTFAARVCQQDAPRPKPHPEPLLTALELLGVPAESTAYVGDAPEDMEMARRAGARAVGVLSSFPTAERLRASQPDALLDSLTELPGLLREWAAGSSHT